MSNNSLSFLANRACIYKNEASDLRPDMILWFRVKRESVLVELAVSYEEQVDKANKAQMT